MNSAKFLRRLADILDLLSSGIDRSSKARYILSYHRIHQACEDVG